MRSSSDPKSVEKEAAAWLARRDRGFTAAEQDEFLQWLREDPRHRECFSRHDQTWGELGQLESWRPAHSAQPNPDLLALPSRRRLRWLLPVSVGLAAALVAGIFLWPRRVAIAPSPVIPAETVALQDYDQRVLEDGSIVDLNRASEVEVRYTAAERQVWLTKGEAHFTVAKNPARPFIVRAGKVGVRAVGTAFDVRLAPESVEVLVTEGRVRILPPTESGPAVPELRAGQRMVLRTTVGDAYSVQVNAVSTQEMSQLMAWQPRMLEFDSAPLAEIVAAFNRHNRVKIVIADPQLAAQPIVASFRSNNVDGFVRLLENGFGIRAERTGDQIVLRRDR